MLGCVPGHGLKSRSDATKSGASASRRQPADWGWNGGANPHAIQRAQAGFVRADGVPACGPFQSRAKRALTITISAEMDADIERGDRLVDRLQAEAGEHPFARRVHEAGRLP